MRRSTIVLVAALAALALATATCGGSDDSPPASTSVPVSTTSDATVTTTAGVATTAEPESSSGTAIVRVVQYAKAGERPPGRTSPLDHPGWRATGSGWKPGDVDLVIRASGGTTTVLEVGARAGDGGAWDQTFVLTGAAPGPYVAVATQGLLRAEATFDLKPSEPVREDVVSGTFGGGPWTLAASRDANGLVCGHLRLGTSERATVCDEAGEQDANGDDTLRYTVTPDPDGFVLAVGASGVAKVRVELAAGEVIEQETVSPSFTGKQLVAISVPPAPVIRTIAAVGGGGQVLTRFTINP